MPVGKIVKKLRDMLPRFPIHDLVDRRLADREFFSKRSLGFSILSSPTNLFYARFIQLRLVVIGAMRYTPLQVSIPHIVCLGSEKQMVGPNTRRVIARMKHEKAVGDCPSMNCPANPMSDENFTVCPANLTVAHVFGSGPSPLPTPFHFLNLLPEPLLYRPRKERLVRASVRTKSPRRILFGAVGFSRDLTLAVLAPG